MARTSIVQVRSGEGHVLTDISSLGAERLPEELPDLFVGPVLVGSSAFDASSPEGGRQLRPGLHAFEGEAARRIVASLPSWGRAGAIVACVPELPDEDALRRWIADPLRPWDAERLHATFYVQHGRRYQRRGTWFASERDRQRWVQACFRRIVEDAGQRMPNGDATIVFELPTDSTFEAVIEHRGTGESLRLVRDFEARGIRRSWTIRRGEWEGAEKRVSAPRHRSLRNRLVQGLASVAILLLSLPVFVLVSMVALVTKVTGGGTAPSTTGPPRLGPPR